MIVSIDGPAGAGKSTIARALAAHLGFIHIDTGAMYRAVTWLALQRGIRLDDAHALTYLAEAADIRFVIPEQGDEQQVFCDGYLITEEIRSMLVSEAVSGVSAVPGVRKALTEAQRVLASGQDVVMDGRDIGTVVLPHAECKIFLTASVEERALRRKKEREDKDQSRSLEDVIAEIEKRDKEDTNRSLSPLRPADDSIIVDTTTLTFQETLQTLIDIVGRCSPKPA